MYRIKNLILHNADITIRLIYKGMFAIFYMEIQELYVHVSNILRDVISFDWNANQDLELPLNSFWRRLLTVMG